MHKDSNHPPQVLKEIPSMIEKMVSKNSSSKAEFDKVKREYQNSQKTVDLKRSCKIDQMYQNQRYLQGERKKSGTTHHGVTI